MSAALETQPSADYQVRLDIFEGPLDLLLFLVRKEEVELYDLSLERLTRQYLDYLAAVSHPDLDRAGDFIAMAAHLIYLKSRRLLPPEQLAPGSEDPIEEEDPRWELIRQLVEYKKFKDAAGFLQAVETTRLDLFPRPPLGLPPDLGSDDPALALGDIGVFDLLNAFQKMLRRFERRDAKGRDTQTVIFEENFTVAAQIERLRGLMAQAHGESLAFTALFTRTTSRVEMVVTFLALLELVRLKHLRVVQAEAFDEIMIFGHEPPVAETAP